MADFVPSGATGLVASSVSSRVAYPSTGSALTVLVTNAGASAAYLKSGNSLVVALVSDIPIQPGQSIAFPMALDTNIAGITATGSASLLVQSGTGTPVIVYSGASFPLSPSLPPHSLAGNAGTVTAGLGAVAISANLSISSTGTLDIGNSPTITALPGAPFIINMNSGAVDVSSLNMPSSVGLALIGPPASNANYRINAFGGAANFSGGRANGSIDAPTTILVNQLITALNAMGFDGTSYNAAGATIRLQATQDWSSGAHGSQISFLTVQNGGTVQSNAMQIHNDGIIVMGTTVASGTSTLQIAGGASTDALIVSGATMTIANLPTLDPHVVGHWWNNLNVPNISAG